MFIILALLALGTFIAWVTLRNESQRKNYWGFNVAWPILLTVILIVSWSVSYDSYLKARVFHDRINEQYRSAITVYEDRAVIDIEQVLTDFRYQGYQENMAAFVKDLRDEIIKYNKTLLTKRLMKKSPVFSWLIYNVDDNMKSLSLLE